MDICIDFWAQKHKFNIAEYWCLPASVEDILPDAAQ